MSPDDQDRYELPTMRDAVYEYEIVRRKVSVPILRAIGPEKIGDWLRKLWRDTAHDEMIVIALNNENQVLGWMPIIGGDGMPTAGEQSYGLDAIFRPIIQLGMKRFIIAIFQSQNTIPDQAGIDDIARSAATISTMLNIDFTDLMIVAGDEWMSLRLMSHGPRLHALAHSIIEDLDGTEADHERLDEHDPEDFAWAFTVLSELASTKSDDVIEAVTRRLLPLVEQMKDNPVTDLDPKIEKLPDGFLSLEDLMSGPSAAEPTEEDSDGL